MQLITVELAFDGDAYITAPLVGAGGDLASSAAPLVRLSDAALGLRAARNSVLWPKENLINLGRTLVPDGGVDKASAIAPC